MNFIDLTGKTYGRLVVLGRSNKPKNSRVWWICECSCGNITKVTGDRLEGGITKSCGCYRKELPSITKFKDLTGQRFGRLVAIKLADKTEESHYRWECFCDCGNTTIVLSSSLISKNTESCGCLRLERLKEKMTTHGKSNTREYSLARTRIRRDKKKKLDTNWNTNLEEDLRNFQPSCAICGITNEEHLKKYKERLHVDHVFPLSKGFGLKPGNAIILCRFHNESKQNKSIEELPMDWQSKIIWNAVRFEVHRQQLQEISCG